MKRLLNLLLLSSGVATKAQTYVREENIYISSTGERNKSNNTITTDFKVKESDGKEYIIYCSKSTGACFIKKISRNGKEYKKYLNEDISKQVSSSVNIKYKPKNKRNDK